MSLQVCAKGHYEIAFNTISTLHVPIECPACAVLDAKARLEDEVRVILDELAVKEKLVEELRDKQLARD